MSRLVRSILLLLLSTTTTLTTEAIGVPEFSSEHAKPRGNLKDLKFVSRIMVPYGPNLLDNSTKLQVAEDRPWRGYGFGIGAAEELAYDRRQHYAYVASLQGYVTVVDFGTPAAPILTDYAIAGLEEVNDLFVCSEQQWLFVSVASRGVIEVYKTVQRPTTVSSSDEDVIVSKQGAAAEQPQARHLELLSSFAPPGGVPSQLLPNKNCTLLAVSNENAESIAYGTVTLVRDLDNINRGETPTMTSIPMDNDVDTPWDDAYVLSKGLHMPLTKNALEYWDEYSPIAEEANFSHVRGDAYRASLFLEGEYLAWANPEETELLVNLQINNGLLRIDVRANKALALAGYGLKDHAEAPIDIDSSDKACVPKTYPNLFALRSPDSIRTIRYNGKLYVLTANEGDDKEFGPYADMQEAGTLFVVCTRVVEEIWAFACSFVEVYRLLTLFFRFDFFYYQNESFGLPGVRLPEGYVLHQDNAFYIYDSRFAHNALLCFGFELPSFYLQETRTGSSL